MARFCIAVDPAAVADGAARPIIIHDTEREDRWVAAGVIIPGPSEIVYSPAGNQDGTRVWVETDASITTL